MKGDFHVRFCERLAGEIPACLLGRNPPSAQQTVSRNCGLGSSKILFNFAAAALVRVAVETRNCKRSRCLVMRQRRTAVRFCKREKSVTDNTVRVKTEKNEKL